MGLDLAMVHGWIVGELSSQHPLRDRVNRLIDYCAAMHAHDHWQQFQALPYGDLSSLERWLERVLRHEPPGVPLLGMWFGLFNPCYDGETVADLYVCGTEGFDPDPDDNDWAVAPEWSPERRYAHSEIMATIYRIAHQNGGLGNDAEYPLCLGYGAFAVQELLNRLPPDTVLTSVGPVGVAVGFDDGDFVLLGQIARNGLKPLQQRPS